MDSVILDSLKAHAAREAPRECCGLVVSGRYWPCRNIAGSDNHFAIDPADYAEAEDAGEVEAVCHSHPYASPQPSAADLTGCEQTGLPWIIINYPLLTTHEFAPSGYRLPLIGRKFSHGVHDCFSIIRDFYAWELGITLPDFERPDNWWLTGGDLYREGFAQAGFAQVPADTLREHDVILMAIRSKVPNHGAVYLGKNVILQHIQDRLSGRTIFGGWYRRACTHVLRHHLLR